MKGIGSYGIVVGSLLMITNIIIISSIVSVYCRSSVSIIIMIIDYKERYIIVYTSSELISNDQQSYHLTCTDDYSEAG